MRELIKDRELLGNIIGFYKNPTNIDRMSSWMRGIILKNENLQFILDIEYEF